MTDRLSVDTLNALLDELPNSREVDTIPAADFLRRLHRAAHPGAAQPDDEPLFAWALEHEVTYEALRDAVHSALSNVNHLPDAWRGYVGRDPSELPAVLGIPQSEWDQHRGVDFDYFDDDPELAHPWHQHTAALHVAARLADQVPRSFRHVREVRDWMAAPCPALNGATPEACLVAGRVRDVLLAMMLVPSGLRPVHLGVPKTLAERLSDVRERRGGEKAIGLEHVVGVYSARHALGEIRDKATRPESQGPDATGIAVGHLLARMQYAFELPEVREAGLRAILERLDRPATERRAERDEDVHRQMYDASRERGQLKDDATRAIALIRWWLGLESDDIAELAGELPGVHVQLWANGDAKPSFEEWCRLQDLQNAALSVARHYGWDQAAARAALDQPTSYLRSRSTRGVTPRAYTRRELVASGKVAELHADVGTPDYLRYWTAPWATASDRAHAAAQREQQRRMSDNWLVSQLAQVLGSNHGDVSARLGQVRQLAGVELNAEAILRAVDHYLAHPPKVRRTRRATAREKPPRGDA